MSTPAAKENLRLEAALLDARRGLRVVPIHRPLGDGTCSCQSWRDQQKKGPCSKPGKHPRISDWSVQATTDETTIRRWWRNWPSANVGIVTGAESGIIVLDVDQRHGGDDTLDQWESKYGKLPRTLQVVTGSKSPHYYFRHPGGKVGNVVGLGPGIDLRGDGGLIIAPPSAHVSGNTYEWDGLDGFDAAIAEAPEWLLRMIGESRNNGKPAREIPEVIPDGEKHSTCVSLAGMMRAKGCGAAEIFATLKELSKRFESAVPEENLWAIAEDIEGRYQPAATASANQAPEGGSLHLGAPFNPFKKFLAVFIPDALLKCSGLSYGAKFTWGVLARHAGHDGDSWPSQDTLARCSGTQGGD